MIGENKDKIEDVKKRLYDPSDKAMSHQREGILHQINHNVPLEWQEDKDKNGDNMKNKFKKPPVSIFKKFFVVSVIFFIGALGFAFYKFSNNDSSVSSDKISVMVIGNSFTKGGDDLPLQIEITNNNNASLDLVNLIIEYPKGAEDSATDVVRLPKDSIGTIKSKETVIRNIKVKLFGMEKSVRNIQIRLEYHPQGSNAVFSKDIAYPVTISLAPISLNIDSPTNTTSNQPISFKISSALNTSLPGEKPILQVTYPSNFIFDSAIPAPTLGNSIWDLSSLTTTNPITVEVKGRIVGQDGDEQVFHAYVGTANGMDQSEVNVVYSSVLQKVLITKPFLDARILVNSKDQAEYAVRGGDDVNVEIDWSNNLSTLITDGQIIANLSGNVFDKSTVKTNNGFYDSVNNQIIWDRNSVSTLSEINPGESGTLTFSFRPASFAGSLNVIKDPQVVINVSIKGRQPQLGSTFNEINNFSEKIVKVLSDFQIASSASYLKGSNPPKAETETTYSINWILSNSSNGIKEAEAKAIIPLYVNFVGAASGETENITYNEVTREVVWNIGQVLPYTGLSSNREASFVVSLKPSLSQVGSIPQLTKEINLSGKDSFTDTLLKSIRSPISASAAGDGRVVK